jgi:hypothetical protein
MAHASSPTLVFEQENGCAKEIWPCISRFGRHTICESHRSPLGDIRSDCPEDWHPQYLIFAIRAQAPA